MFTVQRLRLDWRALGSYVDRREFFRRLLAGPALAEYWVFVWRRDTWPPFSSLARGWRQTSSLTNSWSRFRIEKFLYQRIFILTTFSSPSVALRRCVENSLSWSCIALLASPLYSKDIQWPVRKALLDVTPLRGTIHSAVERCTKVEAIYAITWECILARV